MSNSSSRRAFLKSVGLATSAFGLGGAALAREKGQSEIQGFEKAKHDPNPSNGWKPFSDRKIRVGIAGYGLCAFGAHFGFQNHPNVEVVAVTDLIPSRRAGLAKACGCEKTYPSCEEMIKDDKIEAVFIATDAPSHARLAVAALEHGKHVASAVPAVYGSLEDADRLFEAVKRSGRKYMMFETSYFHADLYAWHQQYRAGLLGELVYSEGEYYHYFGTPLGGYNPKTKKVDTNGWRKGVPPQWYPTHCADRLWCEDREPSFHLSNSPGIRSPVRKQENFCAQMVVVCSAEKGLCCDEPCDDWRTGRSAADLDR